MAKQLNVNLAFSADTSKVKAQLQDLQNQLNKLTLSSKTELGITKDIEDASRAAAELSVHLKNATNQQTGTLDFSKLNQSIKRSGNSLQQYGRTLQSLGPQGQQAFMSLAQAVANSEVPIRRTNAMLKEMGTTLANTARWQLSSSMLHGFMGAIQSAYGYAQDLNESLNNIRIVTGQNIDQMAKFAKEANKAARALSTTTTEYTNASLIYYQQGLNDQQVKERTDITIKMANVARQSAEVVSDQMTAVWNNFYDGSKSLEHYADVMTALGAATASSTDEISEGLNKFAAIANTVGLSYEYAASALATVTATTRQSADVVGTAFKTLFARIQDLELGKTLDDGTTLGSYSQALAKVGVQIKDTSGEMKSMDAILEEMAAKWDTLGKAEQIALAQSVAGVRQYTQLIALMDNWDFMKQNLATSNASSGALQKQADIYAESWEAAADRVTAAAEGIYKALINDEFFIDLLNGVEKVITFVDHLIDNLGGLKGVLTAIGAIVTRVFANQISQGLTNITYNLKMMTEKGRQAEKEARKKFIDDAVEGVAPRKEYTTDVEKAQQQSMRSQLELQQQYMENADRMNAVEAEVNKKMMDRVSILRQQVIEAEKRKETASKTIDDASYGIITDISAYNKAHEKEEGYVPVSYEQVYAKNIKPMKELVQLQVKIESGAKTTYDAMRTGSDSAEKAITELNKQVQASSEISDEVKQIFASLDKASTFDEVEAAVRALNQELGKAIGEHSGEIKNVIGPDAAKKVDQYVAAIRDKTRAELDSADATKQAEAAQRKTSESIKKATGAQKGWSDMLVESANLAFSVASAFQMLSSAWDTIKDPDASGWDKFLSIMMTLGMVIPTFISIYKTLKSVISLETIAKIANAAATMAQTAAEQSYGQVKGQNNTKIKQSTKETWKDTWNKLKNKGKNVKGTWNKNAWDGLSKDEKLFRRDQYLKDNNLTWQKGKGYVDASGNQVKASSIKKALQSGAGKDALKGLGTKIGGAAIIVASVAAAGMIAKAAIDHYNRFETAAKEAEETANAMKATYETVTSAEQEFRSHIDTYSSGVEGLDKLTKGTEEYKEAVRQANNAAVELLNTYKNLKYEINDEGLIVIDEAGLAAAQRESLRRETRAAAASMQAQQDADTARLEADKVNFQRTQMKAGGVHWDNDDTTAVAGGIGAGTALGVGAAVAFANAWNPVGWALIIGGVVAAAIGTGIAAFNNDADVREAETLSALEEFSTNAGGRDLKENEIKDIADKYDASGELAESLLKDIDATNDMIAEMRANTEAIDRNNDLIANQLLMHDNYIAGSDQYQEIVDYTGDIFGQAYKKYINSSMVQSWGKTGISQLNGANAQAKQVWKEYLEYAGLTDKGWQLVDTKGNDNNRIFVYLDEQGARQEKTLNEMQKMYATYLANLEAQQAADDLVVYFSKWAQSKDAEDQAIASFLLKKNFEDATAYEISEMQIELNNAIYEGDITKYLQEKLGPDLELEAQRLGYDNGQALVDAFSNALININKAWDNIDLIGFSEDIQKYSSLESQQFLANLTKSMQLGKAGQEGAQEYIIGFNKLFNGMSAQDIKEAMRRITEIDWSQWDAGREVKKIVEDLGYSLSMSEEEFNNWILVVNNATGAMFNYATSVKVVKELSALTEGLSIGDIITNEQYLLLVSFNQELEKYFRLLGDGTAQLVGDPLEFLKASQNAIKRQKEDAVSNMGISLEEAERRFAKMQEFEEKGWNVTSLTANAWSDKVATNEYRIVPNDTDFWDGLTAYGLEWGSFGLLNIPNSGNMILQTPDGGYISNYGDYGSRQGFTYSDTNGDGKYDSAAIGMKSGLGDIQAQAGYHLEQQFTKGVGREELYNQQKQFLIDIVGMSAEEVAEQFGADAKNATKTQVNNLQIAVSGYLEDWTTYTEEELEKIKDDLFAAEIDYALSADSATERQKMYKSGEIHEDAYLAAQQQAIIEEAWENLNTEDVQDYAEYLAETYSLGQEQAEEVARSTTKMNSGLEELISNWDSWGDILNNSSKSSQEYQEALQDVKHSLSDILDVSEDFVSNTFIEKHLNEIKEAAQGSETAIDALAMALAQDIFEESIKINLDGNTTVINNAKTLMSELSSILQTKLPELKIGQIVDEPALLAQMNGVVQAAQMTTEQANAWYRAMGFVPEFDTATEVVENTVPITTTEHRREYKNADQTHWVDTETSYTEQVPAGTAISQFPTVAAKTLDGKISTEYQKPSTQVKSLTYVGGGSMSNYSSTNIGGNNNSKNKKPTKKTDVVERYKEVTDKIDDVQNAMNDASKAADRLWGPARLKQLEKQNKLIQDEVKLLKQKKKEAQANLIKDRSDLSKAAAAAGVSFNIDEKGNITNYTEKMDALYAELESRENEADGFAKEGKSKEEQDEYIEKYVTPLQDKINELKEAMSQYEETRELLEDIDDQIDDKWNEWQDNNYEQLTYKLELKIEINDRDLEEIEYYLNKAADDFYQMAESAALLVWGNSELNPGKSKLDVYKENYETDNDHLNDLNNQYNTFNEDGIRNISQKDYAAGLKEIHSNALADAQALKEIDDTMLDYYGNTLAMAGEELAKYTDRMEHQTAVLEHYRSIMDIIGKSTDYESMGVILEGQAKTIENELAVAQGNYEMLAGEADYWKQMMDSVDETDPAFAVYKANWEAAESAAREAQDNMLAKTEEWAEAMKAVLENKLAGLAQTLENALTGGTSFDTITTQMERAASLQEEYLTTTNKIYETNKMINTAQQAIDKTTNTVAKQKLKSFQQETAQLQSKKKLSQYELEIQQAKYDLLLAEIALEEAQQAKSTVRLQRDSEGNFGYIYTADANELADAEQKLADAQNNLYNIGLEGANNYVQKYQETMREMYDTLTDIQTRYLNGEFESEEEYHQAMEEAKEYYYQKLQDYSSLYQVSLTTDSRVVKDAWSTDFAGMTQNTESWKTSVNRYVGEVEQAFKQWDQTVQSIKNQTVGKNLDELNTKVGNIVTESNNLTTAITKDGGLLDALQSEITEVGNVALKYASLRGEVQGLILEYQKLAEEAKKTYNSIDFEENDDDKDDTPPGVKGTVGGDEDLSDVGVDKDTDGFDDFDNRIEETSTTYLTSDSSPVTVYTNLGRGTSTKIAGNRLYHKGTISPNTTQYSGYTFYEVFYDQAGIAYPGYLLRKDYADLKQKASSFDTGGYTGSWGSEGKMAMLHEKELILNANDTTNFLASLEVLREIVNTINLHSMNAQLGGLLSTPHWTGADQSQILEQQVHIEASFPGVQDRNEIEEAFNNLINRASQFVNRK